MDTKNPQSPETSQSTAPGNTVIYSSAPNGGTSNGMPQRKPGKGRLLAIAGAAAVVVLGTAGYVFGFYLPNKPENVFNTALTNTGKGYDELVAYLEDKEVQEKFNQTDTSGTFKLESASFSTDGSFKASGDDKNGTFSGDIGLGPTRLTVEGVAKDVEASESPDVYLKLGGIKGLGANFGMPQLDTLDSQWIMFDHSLLDSYLNMAQTAAGTEVTDDMAAPTQEQVADAARAVGESSKRYVFTDDTAASVFKMKEYVGAETVDGKETNHYKVNISKANLKAYIKDLGGKLDASKLNDWSKSSYDQSLSELMDIEGMQQSVDDIKDTDTFDMWVNKDTKLIHKVRFSDTKNPAQNYLEVGLNYAGGDEMPFFLNLRVNEDGTDMTGTLKFSINTKTDVVKVVADIDDESENAVALNISFEVKPGTGDASPEVPTGAISLSEALARIGLDGYLELFNQSLEEAALQAELAPFSIEQ